MPNIPTDINVTVNEGCKSLTINWKKPQKGFHDGYFTDADLTYKLIRLPDNTMVASQLKETSFTDNSIKELNRYKYKVYACNPYGESGEITQESYVAGPAVRVPVTQKFEDSEEYFKKWTELDGNQDNYGWIHNSPYGAFQFGEETNCAEYLINPGIINSGNNADEWIISPPMIFEKDKEYELKIMARSISDEILAGTIGNTNTIKDQEEMGTVTVVYEEGSPAPMKEYKIKLTNTTDGIRCVGLHLKSEYPANGASHIQIGEITVQQINTSSIETISDGVSHHVYGKTLSIVPDNAVSSIYTLNGCKILETRQKNIGLETFPSGIYILKIQYNNRIETFKLKL